MKRFLFFVVIIAGLTASAHSNDNLMFNLNVGDLGGVWNFPLRNNNDDGIIFTLVNIGIEDRRTNLGLKFCPYSYYIRGETDPSEDVVNFSLLNLYLYWNIIALDFGFYAGPFTSINYVFVKEDFFWDRYIFTAGLQAGFRLNMGRFYYNIFYVETGYRLIDGESRYHIGVKVDLIPVFLLLIGGVSRAD